MSRTLATCLSLAVAALLAALGMTLPEARLRQGLAVKIEAPASIAPGELAVLTVAGDASLLAWQVVPATPNFLAIDGGRRAVFTSPEAGSWTFVLAASDGQELVQTTHAVTVSGPSPPGPIPPPGPDSLAQRVRGWRARVTSATAAAEAERLAYSFESIAAQIAAGALKTPEAVIQATMIGNQGALGPAIDAWRPFFESLRAELNRREEAGPLDYAALWREIAGGLRS